MVGSMEIEYVSDSIPATLLVEAEIDLSPKPLLEVPTSVIPAMSAKGHLEKDLLLLQKDRLLFSGGSDPSGKMEEDGQLVEFWEF
mmetsp:Transcript_27163/g.49039  ORF Transcript_27163/g.49039 Transcript_27163/m.49039 type:complete len:85 (+) Transcript_27163:518-772(+)